LRKEKRLPPSAPTRFPRNEYESLDSAAERPTLRTLLSEIPRFSSNIATLSSQPTAARHRPLFSLPDIWAVCTHRINKKICLCATSLCGVPIHTTRLHSRNTHTHLCASAILRILILVHLLTFFILFLSKDQRTNDKNKIFEKALRSGNLFMKVNVSLIKRYITICRQNTLTEKRYLTFF
jgi:hypothetical protein